MIRCSIILKKRKRKAMKIDLIKMSSVIFFSFFLFLPNLKSEEENIYKIEAHKINGQKFKFKNMEGRPMLIVNIATQCGFTPQLKALQKVNQQFAPKGLFILGVPSNDFGGQTPEKNKEVKRFCRDSYGVTFPLTEKMIVKGVKKHTLFQFLTKNEGEISWNFEKFLIDKKGKLVKRFRSGQNPLGKEFINELEKLF